MSSRACQGNGDNETARRKEIKLEKRQHADRPNVHEDQRGPDKFKEDLKRANKGQDPRKRRGIGT